MTTLPYGRQSIDEDDIEAVVSCLRDDFLTQGPRVVELEAALCATTGSAYAAVVSNGTAALHLASLALDVGPGDFGLTSPITFVASANAIRYTGATVGFVDVDPESGQITPETLDAALSQLQAGGRVPRVVVPVDLGGQPVALPEISARCRSQGTRVLHDAAHSLGASWGADPAHRVGDGRFADATILSFHPVKHITTGEGGAVLTPDPEIHSRVADLRSHGIHKRADEWQRHPDDPFVGGWYYEQSALGYNYRLPDINCALGISQLRKLTVFIELRRKWAQRYDDAFANSRFSSWMRPLQQRPGSHSSYHLYVIRVLPQPHESLHDVAARRKRLYEHLRAHQILSQVHYIPVHWQPDFHERGWLPAGGLPGAEQYYAGCLSLPLFPQMTDDDIERVIHAMTEFAPHA